MIVEDQNMSDCFATYGDRPRQDREDFLRSCRRCIRQPVGSNIHHSLLSFRTPTFQKISDFLRNAFVATPVESNANSRMMRAKTIRVMLMDSSIIEKKSQGQENRAELRATDSRLRSRRKRPSRRWLNSSSRYFLKLLKTDISQKFEESLNRRSTYARGYGATGNADTADETQIPSDPFNPHCYSSKSCFSGKIYQASTTNGHQWTRTRGTNSLI